LVWYSVRWVAGAITPGDVGNVGALFVGNGHVADGDACLGKCFHTFVIEELLESVSWRVLDMVL
jgi:hypothetical protein